MSLSRPLITFPLLKLPYLGIEAVVKNADILDVISFALISNRTRQIVILAKIRVQKVQITLAEQKTIELLSGSRSWHVIGSDLTSGTPLVLQKNASPLYTRNVCNAFYSITHEPEMQSLKDVLKFLSELFECSVDAVVLWVDSFSEPYDFGVSTTKSLHLKSEKRLETQQLTNILDAIEVTDGYIFDVRVTETFRADPRLFSCNSLVFTRHESCCWLARQPLFLLDICHLTFMNHEFSANQIVGLITDFFNTTSRKLKYLRMHSKKPIPRARFQIDHLNPMPFCESQRLRQPRTGPFSNTDFSKGFDILRRDGLLATFQIWKSACVLYVWHQRF